MVTSLAGASRNDLNLFTGLVRLDGLDALYIRQLGLDGVHVVHAVYILGTE